MMSQKYRIRVAGDDLVFAAAHFITFDDECERLHGHNYRVAVEVEGPLDADGCVVDFVWVRAELRDMVRELDHYLLLPGEHPAIEISTSEGEVTARWSSRRWVFPAEDCVVLPVANTTAELLARHVAERLVGRLREHKGGDARVVRVEVGENFGQVGVWEVGSRPW